MSREEILETSKFKLRFDESEIRDLAGSYEYVSEDKDAAAIGRKAGRDGYFTKDEFLSLCRWKTKRSQSKVELNREPFINEITRLALSTQEEETRISILTVLYGVGWPTASAVLHFAHCKPYPVLDFRALWSLQIDPPPVQYDFDFWWKYTEFCRNLARSQKVSMRVLDRALWQYSKENQPAV